MTLSDWARSVFFPTVRASGIGRASRAIKESDELIKRMRESSSSNDPVRGLLADLWLERHNVPYVTTIYEANAEMKAATALRRESGKK